MISYRNFVTNERNQRVFFMILGQSKRLVHHILPKKVLLQADIGFDDPATTGNVLAAASILYAFYGDRIQVTPYFDRDPGRRGGSFRSDTSWNSALSGGESMVS